jgi:hypothetical protein
VKTIEAARSSALAVQRLPVGLRPKMSLIRQIWLLLLGSLLLALVGSVAVNVLATRQTLQTQLRL